MHASWSMEADPVANVQGLEAGMQVGRWRLLEELHRGGMATIWSVEPAPVPGAPDASAGPVEPVEVHTATPAIMKVPILHEDPTAIVGFEVEQMILPRLAGPHVPRVLDMGGFDTSPFIVLERIEGESLRPRIDEAPLAPAEVASIGARVADSLHALHEQLVIHHDIKPSNIMFRADGTAVLVDFGLSCHHHLPDLLAEQFRLPMGTGPYISPEQVVRNRTDPRSDLFALGVVLYVLATGERPFGAPTSVAGLRRRLYEEPVAPRTLQPGIPPWLQEVILRCLEPQAEHRYASAAQLAFDLTHPADVVLTERAMRERAPGMLARAGRRLRSLLARPVAFSAGDTLARAPIIVAAIDLSQEWEALSGALRTAARRVLLSEPGARLACVSVLRTSRIGIEAGVDETAPSQHVQRLVQLQRWARPLGLPPERATFHVLEAPDPAGAIIEYARENRVDHILVGARGSSSLRRYMGSVSSRVVAEAPCSVTVVKIALEERGGN
jgi:nucleotide-binding universal stress UspA family protein